MGVVRSSLEPKWIRLKKTYEGKYDLELDVNSPGAQFRYRPFQGTDQEWRYGLPSRGELANEKKPERIKEEGRGVGARKPKGPASRKKAGRASTNKPAKGAKAAKRGHGRKVAKVAKRVNRKAGPKRR